MLDMTVQLDDTITANATFQRLFKILQFRV